MQILEKEYFLSRIQYDTSGCGCWLWDRGCTNKYGNIGHNGTWERAHRASFRTFVGEIPDGLDVLHWCDVKPCIRPDHLFLGTDLDNVADAIRKGIFPMGERSVLSKLTEADVRAIRNSTLLQRELAEIYNTNQQQISQIKLRKRWKHI